MCRRLDGGQSTCHCQRLGGHRSARAIFYREHQKVHVVESGRYVGSSCPFASLISHDDVDDAVGGSHVSHEFRPTQSGDDLDSDCGPAAQV
jgi:hypothetical protein